MAEDGGGDQYIRFLDADGNVQDFGRNALSNSELAGVCFSPDGKALFINIQKDHRTYMITGPFPDYEMPQEPDDSNGSQGGGHESNSGCNALGNQAAVLAPLAALAFRWGSRKAESE
jgi:hypothetical protein